MSLEHARAVADAVLYEGYLLYPYRASSSKNQSRWQFGVLGPPGAVEAGCGEDPVLASQFLIRPTGGAVEPVITLQLRFLQLQQRFAQQVGQAGAFEDVAELNTARVEQVVVSGGEDVEPVRDDTGAQAGRLVRRRRPLHATLRVCVDVASSRGDELGDLLLLSVRVENVATGAADDKEAAIAASFIGAHLLLQATGAEFLSMTDPPEEAAGVAAACKQHRCWPVLAGPDGDTSVLLVSPIILYDHPELAPQSAGALFDSTEIDEILTLRVMTLTDEEKSAARATDPRAAEIIDRCDALSPEAMAQMHGILRDPHALEAAVAEPLDGLPGAPGLPDIDLTSSFGFDGEVPWWDPAVDAGVAPESDKVVISGVPVSRGSIVRVHPSRRADAQDLFFAGQVARVTAVHSDVDGDTHVAVVLVDDPAADLHDWYGRYLYFAPDELEPIFGHPSSAGRSENRKESHP